MTEKILLLGGTREARMIAGLLAKRDDCTAILSLAGVTSSPPDTGLEKRIGGFGGAEKMAAWMQDEAITTLIDATHPYAARISANAAWAAEKTGTGGFASAGRNGSRKTAISGRNLTTGTHSPLSFPTGRKYCLPPGRTASPHWQQQGAQHSPGNTVLS